MSVTDPARGPRTAAPDRGRHGWAVRTLRALAAICLALGPLGILDRSPFVGPQYALVLDDTPSVRRRFPGFAAETLRRWREFRGGGHPVVAVGEHPHPAGAAAAPAGFTDLPAALRAAAALGAPGVKTRLLLATDGLSRQEDLAETVRALRERGASVWALGWPQPAALARAVGISLPESVFLQEPFLVRGRVQSSRRGAVPVRLTRDGATVAETTVDVDVSGFADVEFPQEFERVGRVRYALEVPGSGAPAVAGEVSAAQSPRVLWLCEDPGAAGPLIGELRGAGIDVELAHPADLVDPKRDLAHAQVIVLDDVSAPALGEGLLAEIRQAVGSRGAGLVVIGGRRGLGAGEYAGAGIEALLPVTAGFRAPPPPQSVALVLVLDTSFSMNYRGRGESSSHSTDPRKIDVAKESAKEVVRIVRPGDRFGVLGNSTDIFWILPLGPVGDPATTLERIDRMRAFGDGIYFYSVLYEAREALRREPTGVRHVLVLCDAEDIDQYEVEGRGHAFELVRSMAEEGITVSILAIGRSTDKDVPFLRTAALLGQGDFYLVPRIVALPRYFVSEYRRISSSRHFLEAQLQPLASEQSAEIGAGPLPPLGGVALVTPREGARALLLTDLGPPLLVTGAYGRGKTAVFTGDDGHHWAALWVGGPGTRRFWLQLLFTTAPQEERARGFSSTLDADLARGRLRLRYAGANGVPPPWETLWALPADGAAGAPERLNRVGLRTYRGVAPLGPEGFRRVTITEDPQGARPLFTAGYAVPAAEEDLPEPPGQDLVDRLVRETGGAWVERPEELATAQGLGERLRVSWPVLFVAFGVLFLLAEVVVRVYREE